MIFKYHVYVFLYLVDYLRFVSADEVNDNYKFKYSENRELNKLMKGEYIIYPKTGEFMSKLDLSSDGPSQAYV